MDMEPITYKIQRKPITYGFAVEYLFCDENGQILMRAKDRYNPHRWKFGWFGLLLLLVFLFSFVQILLWFISTFFFRGIDFSLDFQFIITGLLFIALIITRGILWNVIDINHCTIHDPDDFYLGKIQSKKYVGIVSRQPEYTVLNSQGNQEVFLQFERKYIQFGRRTQDNLITRATIKYPTGMFNARAAARTVSTSEYKGYYETSTFTVSNLKNDQSFTVNWIDHQRNPRSGRQYTVESLSQLSPFLIFAISIRLISCSMVRYFFYDHTPSSD